MLSGLDTDKTSLKADREVEGGGRGGTNGTGGPTAAGDARPDSKENQ